MAGSKESINAFKLVLVADFVGTLRGLKSLLSFSGVEISAWGGGPDKGMGWYKKVTSN